MNINKKFSYITNHTMLVACFNDMWRYFVKNDSWTCVSGNTNSENIPSARAGAAAWYDSSTQEVWLFGGEIMGSRT